MNVTISRWEVFCGSADVITHGCLSVCTNINPILLGTPWGISLAQMWLRLKDEGGASFGLS